MHSIWHRLNSLLTYGSTTLLVICILTSLTDFLVHKSNPIVRVKPAKIEAVARGPEGDWAWLSVNLEADLRSVFSWNTKQLFVAVVASFSTPKNHVNEAVIWTDIIAEKSKANIRHQNLAPQYAYTLSAQDHALRGTPFNLTVSWDVMPIVALADDASDKQNRDLSSSPRWSSHAQFVPETYILWAGPPDDDDFSAYQQLQQGSAIFLGWMLTGAFVLTGALYMQHRSFTGFQFPDEYFKPPRPGRLKQPKPTGKIPGAVV